MVLKLEICIYLYNGHSLIIGNVAQGLTTLGSRTNLSFNYCWALSSQLTLCGLFPHL